ncbi:MAG: Lrp/AsnC family transcriptional regulator [Candidatus Bathyarchaeia archaeon]|jgi:DNA-binding Lrp family transcriptional regulator
MDSVDLKIIGLLMQDAQMPFSSIAKTLGLGVDTVIRRYNRLKSEGVIHSAAVTVDLKKCGFKGHVFFLLTTLAGADPQKMYDSFSKMTNVLTVIHTIGDYDMLLHCIYSDVDNLLKLQKALGSFWNSIPLNNWSFRYRFRSKFSIG